MKKVLASGMLLVALLLILLTSCQKEVNCTGCPLYLPTTEEPGNGGGTGGEPGYVSQEYPSTAQVIYKAVTDVDGNCYDAVKIGDQVWMAQNLRTTRYADSTSIPMGTSRSDTEPYRYPPGYSQDYGQNEQNVAYFGYLYNWPAVIHTSGTGDNPGSHDNPSGLQGICPDGWHLPSNAEWMQLVEYMHTQPLYWAGGDTSNIAKALAAASWAWEGADVHDPNAPGYNRETNNASGFSALPAGERFYSIGGFGLRAEFWSATGDYPYDGLAYLFRLYNHNAYVRGGSNFKFAALSVRCVRN